MRPSAALLLCAALLPTCLFAAPAPGFAQEVTDGAKKLTLEQASGRESAPSYSSRAARMSWNEDGRWLSMRRDGKSVLVDPLTMEDAPEIQRGRPEQGLLGPDSSGVTYLLKQAGIDEGIADAVGKKSGAGQRSSDGQSLVVEHDGKYYMVSGKPDHEKVEVMSSEDVGGQLEFASLGANGKHFAWVTENDLYIKELGGKTRRVTENGGPEYFNGKLDWVYQEEIYGRGDFKGFWWSPDGKYVAFLASDEEAVFEFTLVDHIENGHFRVKPEVVNYPKVGDPNPTVRLGIAEAKSGKVKWMDLSEYPEDLLITRVMWTPQADRCLFVVADRIQTYADMRAANPATGKHKLMIRESAADSWTPRPAPPMWLDNGDFIWQSHRTGYRHLYLYDGNGKLKNAITAGDWQVRRIMEIDEVAGILWFSGTNDSAIDSNVYRINMDGTGLQRLTEGRGTHRVSFNHDRSLMLDRVSSLSMPEEVRLCDGDGKVLKVLDVDSPAAADAYLMAKWEVHEISARDGMKLDVSVLKPVPFDANANYPVWISTYSGPDAPSVRNSWNGSAWNQFLAQNGIIVMQVNVRSASGKGLWATKACYKQLGLSELNDLEDAVDWLCAKPWADADRVGITGYSYGGFMSAFALVFSDKFALAIAGGGVYDWRMYDTIYTERYMSTPELNPEGYAKTSILEHAGQLNGYLHMHHGEMDDNVHLQNMMQFIFKLQEAGKTNWSMMIYPQTRHGIGNRELRWHSRMQEWDLIQEHLLGSKN
ncbi:MAG: DPP IV N-terminal domain-containing protein [Planctomycetes bacterium]|nr:DPP IV N-terminal domain-containing protein [Planctomycetota bacterium]